MSQLPNLPADYQTAPDFDWAMHPGGATILTGAERAVNITHEHMRASYDTYIRKGNSSSATIFSVLNRLRHKDMDALAPGGSVKDYVVGCAFGPGITLEMCMLKRHKSRRPGAGTAMRGLQTPPMIDSDGASSDDKLTGTGEQRRGSLWRRGSRKLTACTVGRYRIIDSAKRLFLGLF
jgi:type III polyketide synthase